MQSPNIKNRMRSGIGLTLERENDLRSWQNNVSLFYGNWVEAFLDCTLLLGMRK